MGTRVELQELLERITSHVYFQPPASVRMSYPCIVYTLDRVDTRYANNKPYNHHKSYSVMVIDKNPDSEIPDAIAELPMSSFKTKYTKDNLNHFVYKLYF